MLLNILSSDTWDQCYANSKSKIPSCFTAFLHAWPLRHELPDCSFYSCATSAACPVSGLVPACWYAHHLFLGYPNAAENEQKEKMWITLMSERVAKWLTRCVDTVTSLRLDYKYLCARTFSSRKTKIQQYLYSTPASSKWAARKITFPSSWLLLRLALLFPSHYRRMMSYCTSGWCK